jgi:hypothetical protein
MLIPPIPPMPPDALEVDDGIAIAVLEGVIPDIAIEVDAIFMLLSIFIVIE